MVNEKIEIFLKDYKNILLNKDLKKINQGQFLEQLTNDFIDHVKNEKEITFENVGGELFYISNEMIQFRNELYLRTCKPEGTKKLPTNESWDLLKDLMPYQISQIIVNYYNVVGSIVETTEGNVLKIYCYCNDKENMDTYGLYQSDDLTLRYIISKVSINYVSDKKYEEILSYIKILIRNKIVKETTDRDFIPFRNGYFDYKTKKLKKYNPNMYFFNKMNVDYNKNAQNVEIQMPDGEMWDVESWFSSLADTEEKSRQLWEIVGAAIRYNVDWGKVVFLYNSEGNNGKGSLIQLIEDIVGDKNIAPLNLEALSNDFKAATVNDKKLILGNENPVGIYIDKSDVAKSLITGDSLLLNPKGKTPFKFKSNVFTIQCLNDYPKLKDKSGSMYRRVLFIKMDKEFTGIERKYIKNDYLRRKEILEYVAWRLMNMKEYYQLTESQTSRDELENYKLNNDTTRQFYNFVIEETKWEFLPKTFLYDLYKGWYKDFIGGSGTLSKTNFYNEFERILKKTDDFEYRNSNTTIRTKKFEFCYEPLIKQFKLENWTNPKATNAKDEVKFHPERFNEYERGYVKNVRDTINIDINE